MFAARKVAKVDLIARAYRISEEQREVVTQIVHDFYAAHSKALGKDFSRYFEVHHEWLDRNRELLDVWKQKLHEPGAEASVGPPRKLYEKYENARSLAFQWTDDHPYDWNDFIRQIEDVIPKDQVEKGRKRLAEQYPHGLSSRARVEIVPDKPKDDPLNKTPDRWEAYYKEFVGRHELTGGQADAAKSILHEVAKRALRLDRTLADQIARLGESDESKTAALIAEAFGFDIDDLFEEFRSRLDALLTTAQRHRPATPAISDTNDDKQIPPSLSASEISER